MNINQDQTQNYNDNIEEISSSSSVDQQNINELIEKIEKEVKLIQEIRPFDKEEFLELAIALEEHHGVFYKLWSIGRPLFSRRIPTACVEFDKTGECVNFLINPDFWETQSKTQKLFIICHECLHILLYHGHRICNLQSSTLPLANKALDVVVNHSLINKFGFKREYIDPKNLYCWIDTVFKNKIVEENKSFEYYFLQLEIQQQLSQKSLDKRAGGGAGEGQGEGGKGEEEQEQDQDQGQGQGENQDEDQDEDQGQGQGLGPGNLVDDHSGLTNFDQDAFERLLDKHLSDHDKSAMKDFITQELGKGGSPGGVFAGTSPGSYWKSIGDIKVVKKKKWETVIKKWASKFMREKEEEQWVRDSRRLTLMDPSFFIPSDHEIDFYKNDKIKVWFFQDTSGSCSGLVRRFFTAAKSLPPEKFDVKMHCFDTRVFETSLETKKLYGFGGTSFSILESYIQQYIRQHNEAYPKAVFVITDGFGDYINPQYPKVWHWFLSTNYTKCIHDECNIYNLSNFE